MLERQKQQLGRDRVSRLVSWGHWFAFFNGFLAMIVGTRYLDSVGYPDNLIGWGYLTLSTIGHFTFLAFIVYLIIIFPVTLLLPYSKILRGFAAIVATLGLCVLLYDTIIFDDYGLHLSPFVFDLAWADLNALLHGTSYIVTPIAILILELTLANFLWKRIEKIRKYKLGNKAVAFVGICFISSHLIHIWADATDVTEITHFDDAYPASYPATAKSFMESYGIERRQSKQTNNAHRSSLHYPTQPLQCHKDKKNNVLVIAIDSLRADLVNAQTMPFLSQYAAKNDNFTQHLSGGNQFRSGMFSLLYGLQGSYNDAPDLHYQSPVLTRELKSQGYKLGLFTPTNSFTTPNALIDDFELFSSSVNNSQAQSDLASVRHFKHWQSSQSSPWFALLNLKSPDSYDTPVGFLGIKTVEASTDLKPAQRVLFNQYRQSLNFIDRQIQAVVEQQPENTMIIITGISGKMFTSNLSEAETDLSPGSIHVPMIIHWPDQQAAKSITYRTSHYGLVPTIMTHVLGCTNPASDYSAGRSMLEPSHESWVYVGDKRIFAIYQKSDIIVIDRHGKYRIFDKDYQQRADQKMNAPELIEVMREGRRLYIN